MKYSALIILAVAALGIGACKSKKNAVEKATTAIETTENTETDTHTQQEQKGDSNDSLFASIERTPCFGTCPIYIMEIYDSGYVEYIGKRFVDNVGKFHAKVEHNKLQAIRDKAIEIGYFDLKDEYPSQIADFPSTITTVKLHGKRKRVFNKQNAPQKLYDFQSYMDTLFADVKWIPFPEVEDK